MRFHLTEKKSIFLNKFHLVFLILSCSGLPQTSFGQATKITFYNNSLTEVIQKIEQVKKTIIFNYDPELIRRYSFTGTLDLDQEDYLKKLLYDTPLDFEISRQIIILFLEDKKEFRICGRILDEETGTPLSFASIIANDNLNGTHSDENGDFDFSFKAHKNQSVQISYLGYHPKNYPIRKLRDCPVINLAVNADLMSEEVIVIDYLLDGITEGDTYSGVEMDYERLSGTQSVVERDILKTTQFLPGITSTDESAANLQIRGGTADQNLILWEGATIYNPGHFFGMISAINPFVVDKVNVYKGVFDPRFDNRVGGIIDISLQDSVGTQVQGGVGTTFSEAHGYVNVPLVDSMLSVLVSGRNSLSPWLDSPTIGKYGDKVFALTKVSYQKEEIAEGYLDGEQSQRFYDWNTKLIFKPSDKILFQTGFFDSNNHFNYDVDLFEEDLFFNDKVFFRSRAFTTSLEVQPLSRWKSTLSFSRSYYKNNYDYIVLGGIGDAVIASSILFNDIVDQSFLWANTYQFSGPLSFHLGYDYNYKAVNFDMEIYDEEDSEPFREDFNFVNGHFHNIFAAFDFKKKNFQVNGGLRGTYYQEEGKFYASPRINIQYALHAHWKLKAATGIFHQFISQLHDFGWNELGVPNPIWIINRTETESSQKANKLSAGLVFHKNSWLIDVETYRNFTTGLNTVNPIFNGAADIFEEFEMGSSKAVGLDFLLKKRWKPYTVWFNYSLSKVQYHFPEILEEAFPASNDQRHNLSLANSFQYKKWNFTLSSQYRTGLPYSTPDGITFDDEDNDYLGYVTFNDNRLADYLRLDLNIHYRFTAKKSRFKGECAVGIINLLNKMNPFSRDYFIEDEDEDGNEIMEIAYLERGLLRRTPSVMLRFYWE